MDILFKLYENETRVTPVKLAEALISRGGLTELELEELADHLKTHARFNMRRRNEEMFERERGRL